MKAGTARISVMTDLHTAGLRALLEAVPDGGQLPVSRTGRGATLTSWQRGASSDGPRARRAHHSLTGRSIRVVPTMDRRRASACRLTPDSTRGSASVCPGARGDMPL